MHKEPVRGYSQLQQLTSNGKDTVIIAYIGMSNGAGPMIAANTLAPVITVPATVSEYHEDVWSCLRTPSNVPVSTILNPKNAALQALQILGMHNAGIYAALRMKLEERLVNYQTF
jgi:phosphoribosylaminoimidazole carboxylase PurE protein